MEEKIKSVLADLEKIKSAEFCVPEGNQCGIFVLPSGEHIEICGIDLLIAICELLKIEIEWDFG